MSSDNNQMASTSDQPPQVAPTQARNDIPMKAATRLSLPPNTVEKMVALQNNLHIETFKEGNLQQRMKELRVLANINADEAEDEFFENVERNPHLTAIALYNKRAVGYISCKMISNDMALYVYHIGVLPKYRKRGIGSALMHYAITNIAKKLTSLVGLILHVYDYEEDLIRLFSRFGFTDNPRGQRKEDPESWRVYNRLANEKVDVKEPPRKKYKEEPVEITIEVEIPAINTKSRDIEDSDDLYMAVARFPHLSAFAILNGEKIGVMSCAEIEQNEYKQYLIMSLGVVPEHVVFKGKVFELLLKHAISTAEKTDDIEMVTYFCKNGDDVPFKLMNRLNFHLWKPYEDFYDNTYEDKQLFIKPIEKNLPQLANIANDSDDMDDQGTSTDGQENAGRKAPKPVHRDLDIESLDLNKSKMLKKSLRMAYVTAESLQTLKQINALIYPTDHIQHESLFRNVLEIPELTCIAFFDCFPCGYIICEKVHNRDGSSHLSIVTIGVTPDRRGRGIGGALLDRAIKTAKKMADVKFLTAVVPANDDFAERLFKRQQFKQCGSLTEEYGAYQGHIFSKSTGN